MDRNSGGLGRKAIERRFRRVVARDGARRAEDDLSLFSLEPRDRDRNRILRIEFCEWNPIARRRLEFVGTEIRAKGNSGKHC